VLDFGDGTTMTGTASQEGEILEFTHIYGTVGNFTPTLTVTDKLADPARLSTTIDLTPVESKAVAVSGGTIFVGGGDNVADRILVYSSGGLVTIRLNNSIYSNLGGEKVVVFGNGRNDTITVSGAIS